MRALQVTDDRRLEPGELPDPEPGAGEVAVDVAFCGICGSDLHMLPSPVISPGTVMGHEFSGRIAALGDGVEDWEVGERVCVLPGHPCGACPSCTAGNEHLCVEAPARGHGLGGRQGAFAERISVHAEPSSGSPTASPTRTAPWSSRWPWAFTPQGSGAFPVPSRSAFSGPARSG